MSCTPMKRCFFQPDGLNDGCKKRRQAVQDFSHTSIFPVRKHCKTQKDFDHPYEQARGSLFAVKHLLKILETQKTNVHPDGSFIKLRSSTIDG